jgi:hypothetical protein
MVEKEVVSADSMRFRPKLLKKVRKDERRVSLYPQASTAVRVPKRWLRRGGRDECVVVHGTACMRSSNVEYLLAADECVPPQPQGATRFVEMR